MRRARSILAPAAVTGMLLALPAAAALPVSLDQVPVPEPKNLAKFVKDKAAAIRLGKALFWDMQLGSDGVTACATCHFHAGTDSRTRNTLHPGAGGAFDAGRPNAALRLEDFPFRKLAEPDFGDSAVLRSHDDVVGTQGVLKTRYEGTVSGEAVERSRAVRDGVFDHSARNVRQVTGRNAPSVVNAVFNLVNFLDGRANHFFNGVNPFGVMDTEARVLLNGPDGLAELSLTGDLATNPYALDNASLASQAVGPPLSDVEMSATGRDFRELGRKMLSLRPLARQVVHPSDSVLGSLAVRDGKGLATTYEAMVRAAFRDEFWNGAPLPSGVTHAQANFSLFFGLAVQLYEATLVSDDTPFDRFVRGNPAALTDRQLRGMNLFFSGGTACAFCHAGPEFTAVTATTLLAPGEPGFIEVMAMGDGAPANYDIGFYNIGVRPTADDLGRGGRVTLNGKDLPLSFTDQHFERDSLPFTPLAQPGCVNDFLGDPPNICPPADSPVSRTAVKGAFKVPSLRNVELTGPYMHNGGMATLLQVVEFYVRGGDFRANVELDPIVPIAGLQGDEERQAELVDFLLALTDDRVRWERAPFDHPQLLVPDGHDLRIEGDPRRRRALADRVREIPAVGAAGRQAQGLPPVKPFLADALDGPALSSFHFQP